MKTTIRLLLLIFITGINSCGSEDDNSIVNSVANKKPKTIEYENRVFCSYSYTNDNKLSKIINYHSNNNIHTYDIYYSENEPTECVHTYTADPDAGFVKVKFEKIASNKILATVVSSKNTNSIHLIILNDKGLPIKINDIEDGISIESEGYCVREFFYYPNTPIIRQIRMSNKYSTGSTYTYEYDNYPGMMCSINNPIWFMMYYKEMISGGNEFMCYVNNVAKVMYSYRSSSGTLYTDIAYDSQYTYDDDNFPISIAELIRDDYFTINY